MRIQFACSIVSCQSVTSGSMEAIIIRRATMEDASAIASVLALNRDDRGLYQKPLAAIIRAHPEFVAACNEVGAVVGCAALHRESADLAEIYAVAVAPQLQAQGIGRRLVEACEQHAGSNNISRLWLATIKPQYFSRYGFRPISRWRLPASTLLRKLRQTFEQPSDRWLPAVFGRHTFMLREVLR